MIVIILGFSIWSWRREWQPSRIFLPGELQGQKNLVGYSPWGRKESDMTERPVHTHVYDGRIGRCWGLVGKREKEILIFITEFCKPRILWWRLVGWRLSEELQFEPRGSLLAEFPLAVSALVRPSTVWMMPMHIMQGKVLYLKFTNFNVFFSQKPSS